MVNHSLKVAVSGFPGTGKTTLVKAISERFDLPIIQEDMFSIGNASNLYDIAIRQNRTLDLPVLKRKLIESYLSWDKKRTEAYLSSQTFIADRCEADLLDFWLLRFSSSGSEIDQITNFLLKNFCNKIQKFDLIIMTPLSPPFSHLPNEEGNKRKSGFTLHVHNAAMTSGLIQSFTNTPILRLPTTAKSIDERLNLVSVNLNEIISRNRRPDVPPELSSG